VVTLRTPRRPPGAAAACGWLPTAPPRNAGALPEANALRSTGADAACAAMPRLAVRGAGAATSAPLQSATISRRKKRRDGRAARPRAPPTPASMIGTATARHVADATRIVAALPLWRQARRHAACLRPSALPSTQSSQQDGRPWKA
jgi:hypothetical protein